MLAPIGFPYKSAFGISPCLKQDVRNRYMLLFYIFPVYNNSGKSLPFSIESSNLPTAIRHLGK